MKDTSGTEQKDKEEYLIKLSKEIAYEGKIGRRREKYCLHNIRHKKDIIKQICEKQIIEVKNVNKFITCRRACEYSSCCMEFVNSTVKECELIVYYLYHNEKVLRLFVKNYPKWLEKVNEIENVLTTLEKLSLDFIRSHDEQLMGEESEKYYRQKIACPFLNNNLCSIYEVRPYSCAGYYVTTPLSQCHPDYIGEVPVKRHLPGMEIADTEFYYKELERPLLLCMQKAVYGILEKGYFYLSTIPGLEGIEKEAINDKKVRNKYKKYVRSEERNIK